MDKKLELKDFDILGIIRLNDIKGIEKFVTPVFNEDGEVIEYLSRSKEYYNVKSMKELSLEREELKSKLTRELTRKNFVIVENMLNCSAKVYFRKLEDYISSGRSDKKQKEVLQALKCFLEDVKNILVLLQQDGLINVDPSNILPEGEENAEKRAIEMDNKAMLYLFAKSLNPEKIGEDIEVVIPGYGGLYIGPFLKVMYGYDFTNVLKSKYINETRGKKENVTLKDMMSSERPFMKDKKILLLDDNVGTGDTLHELKSEFQSQGIRDILLGAIQYNWRNFYRVSVGEKSDIGRFNPSEMELLTPINYAGHKLYEHAIDELHVSGKDYIAYLKSKSYQKDEISDFRGSVDRGILCASLCGIELMPEYEGKLVSESYPIKPLIERYKDNDIEISNPISQELINAIIQNIIKLEGREGEETEKNKRE